MSRKTFFAAALTLTLVVTAGCTDSNTTKQQPKVSADQAQAAPTLEPVTAPLSDYGKYMPLKRQSETVTLGSHQTYNLAPFFTGQTVVIAPDYLYQQSIYYTHVKQTSDTTSKSYIYRYSQGSNDNQVLHTVNRTIGMMTGVSHYLFWVESNPTKSGQKWAIRSMDLKTENINTLDQGISRHDTAIPYLDASSKRISWMTQEATPNRTKTILKSFDVAEDTIIIHQQYILKEGKKQEGQYPFDFRRSDAGLILHTSTFKNGHQAPTLETFDGTFKRRMNGLIDFEHSKKYVATGEEGSAIFMNKKAQKTGYQFKPADNRLTVDAFRFLSADRVIFRESISKLWYADLARGTVAPLTEMADTTSKPIYVNGKLAYGVSDDEQIEFHVIDLKK
ncbi:hypothetical protein [Exiguobacterium sp. 17-1]|uniref:hypothetical protein n=1 Tax=Exiguobacterium sp. 17-1 TaxID=2931981 RepID=UPI00200006F4|nr:hypothetical protein [Exiguobacterium sp. 17-1]MCK2157256.1 hypothetical protein [Exiguobacterium sp. 17-1]